MVMRVHAAVTLGIHIQPDLAPGAVHQEGGLGVRLSTTWRFQPHGPKAEIGSRRSGPLATICGGSKKIALTPARKTEYYSRELPRRDMPKSPF
jgi:hypothetical protein